ncbi:MAG: YlbF family regulator [Eubacteriales bacterium]
MTIFELARALGEQIRQHEVLRQYFAAKAAYDDNAELQGKLFEYETQRKILGDEFKKEPEAQNADLLVAIRARIGVLAQEIVATDEYRQFEDAQQKVNGLMSRVNEEINVSVFGAAPAAGCAGCSGNCGGCSGCGEDDDGDGEGASCPAGGDN